ncbi:hypothetical protein K474DRAFT_254773 [Panus rudis PR-1116 ss-1]|nr:hypothetical protein K474DRAFT_254773 [Panus rudis PR-1116 ss-1]
MTIPKNTRKARHEHDDEKRNPDSLTYLREYLNKMVDSSARRNMPVLNPALRERARNCIKRSEENNDLLEFIGDRAINLIAALLVDKNKLNSIHHSIVRQVICSNDTLGRLSYHLRLHERAKLDARDLSGLGQWDPSAAESPPKVFGDLFEAYAGAIFIQYGWDKLKDWLQRLFDPIIKAATTDFWFSSSPEKILGIRKVSLKYKPYTPETKTQAKLLDYVEFKRSVLSSQAQSLLDALPPSIALKFDSRTGKLQEPDVDKAEVAGHVINMWICQIVVYLWPEYHEARAKAAHMLTTSRESPDWLDANV